jgi:tetratricopeptide (TPR) repeat protein
MESAEKGGGGARMTRTMGTLALAILFAGAAAGQSMRSLMRDGNGQYKDQKYSDAEVSYRKALEKDQDFAPGHYNLGNSLYRQDKGDEAIRSYENALVKAVNKQTKAEAYYNIGNAHMKGQRYQEALKSYIESLKLNPNDQDTKYNLSYALEKLKQQQQQQQNKQNKDDKKDQKQDQEKQKQDQQKKDQQKQDQQKQDQQKQQQNQQQPQQSQEKKMAKAEAERILDVLKNNEKDVQKKLRVRQGVRVKTEKDW